MRTATDLGNRPDKLDERDYAYRAPNITLPAACDLRRNCPPAYDQLPPMKSCSANATAAALCYLGNTEGTPIPAPSRLFIYYNARVPEGTASSDAGATIRDAVKSVVKSGGCAETLWPYEPANVTVQPPQTCYAAATVHAVAYYRIERNLDQLRACIAEGFPFIFGMQAYMQPFEAAEKNVDLPLPAAGDTLCGGHAVLAAGYDDAAKTLLVLNSLGPRFGDNGYLRMPYAYLSDDKLTYDFWTIRRISVSS
jgi:C1A family cysteine protease